MVVNDLKGNGAERVVITLAREFAKMGHRCDIVCFNGTIEYDVSDLSIHYFWMKYWRWIPRKIRGQVVSWLLDRRIFSLSGHIPDLILSNLLPCDRIMSRSRLPNVHFVMHSVLSLERNVGKGFGELEIYEKKPAICVSEGVQKDLESLISTQKGQAVTIHNPVDVEDIVRLGSVPVDLPCKKYIIHVGKFKTEKRHDILIRAFAQSTYKGDLVLVGQGRLLQDCRELAKELGVENRVHFAGYKKNPFPFIKSADLLVLPSDYEGFGMVLVEAISLAVPVISSECPGGPAEILRNNQMFRAGDVEQLASMLSKESFSDYKVELNPKFTARFAAEKYLSLIK